MFSTTGIEIVGKKYSENVITKCENLSRIKFKYSRLCLIPSCCLFFMFKILGLHLSVSHLS